LFFKKNRNRRNSFTNFENENENVFNNFPFDYNIGLNNIFCKNEKEYLKEERKKNENNQFNLMNLKNNSTNNLNQDFLTNKTEIIQK